MKTVKFYGSSDDLIEVEGIAGADEFNAMNDGPVMATFVISAVYAQFGILPLLRVYAIYDGCWTFAAGLFNEHDEHQPCPTWPIRTSKSDENEYSMCLQIDVPDDASVKQEYTK